MNRIFINRLITFALVFCLAFSGGENLRIANATEAGTESENEGGTKKKDDGKPDESEANGNDKSDGSEKSDSSDKSDVSEKTDGAGADAGADNDSTASDGTAKITDTSTNALQKTIDQAKKNAAAAQSALDGVNKKIDSLSNQEEELTAEEEEAEDHLAEIIEELASLEMQLEEIEDEIETTCRELEAAEEDEKEQYEMMKLRIAYMYENSDSSQLAAILSKGSIAEMLNALEYMNSVYEYDRNLLDEYEETVEEIKSLKADLENERSELEMVQQAYENEEQELEKAIMVLQAKIGDVDRAIANATKKAKAYEATIAAENAKIKKAQQEQARLEEEAKKRAAAARNNKKGGDDGDSGESKNPSKNTSISGSSVVDYACQFVGNPYVFGGNSLYEGTDCSGFVNLVFSHFGVGVPRSSVSMQHAGNEVSFDSAQPGDVVCYAGHVAIYIGGGRIVHAKGSRYGITTDNIIYSSKSVITIRRVL